MPRVVTDTDRAIIRMLQQNARVSYAEVSRATGIPESTVRRRMDRLHQRGVIQFSMLADPARLGYDLRVMIGLKVELARLDAVAERVRELNEVTFAAMLTGAFDIMVHVVVQSQEALVDFVTRRLAAIEGVRATETFVMPSIIKPMTAWVLPEVDFEESSGRWRGPDGDLDSEPDQAAPRRRGRQRRAAAT